MLDITHGNVALEPIFWSFIKLAPIFQQAHWNHWDLTGTQLAVFILLPSLLYLFIVTLKSWSRLSAFPGTFWASLSYLPMLRARRSGLSHKNYASLSSRYGTLVRIGPNDLLSADPDHLRQMSSARSRYERSSWYKATRLDPYHDMMGSTMDKASHARIRSKIAAGYTGKDIPTLEEDLDTQIQQLVKLVERAYLTLSNTKVVPVNFSKLADFYAHDARSNLSFGRPLGMLERNEDVHGIIAIVKPALEIIQIFTDIPLLQKIFLSNIMLRLFGPKPTDSFGVGKLMGMAREFVADRFAPGAKDQNDLLGSFLRHGLDRRSAESEVMFPIIAGSDTTSNAIKTTVSHLAANPRVAGMLHVEFQSASRKGELSCPATNEETSRLPYLQAVVWEGLRVHPPFGGLIMKAVGPEGDTVNGNYIPPGTRIGHSTWAVTHDPSVFGNDVDAFRPERWLEADEETRSLMKKYTELVFGSGRWGCPGRIVAIMELQKVLVELFREFNFKLFEDKAISGGMRKDALLDGSELLVITRYNSAI